MILLFNPGNETLPTISLCNTNIELFPKLSSNILHIGKGNHWWKYIAELHRGTVMSCLPKTDKATRYNYQNFIRTMAKIMPKYFDKIRR